MASSTAKQYAPTSSTSIPVKGGTVKLDFYAQLGRRKHVYMIGDKEIPNVTKLLDCLDKPALVSWAANETAQYVLDNTTKGQVIDEVDFPAMVEKARNARYIKSDQGKAAGAAVHDWIEQYINWKMFQASVDKNAQKSAKPVDQVIDALDSVNHPLRPEDPINEAVKSGVAAFLQWESENKVVWLVSEFKLYSPKCGYCGTTDAVARVNGVLSLIDLKTTNTNKTTGTGIYPEYWLQLAAYWQAYKEMGNPYGSLAQRMIIRVGKTPLPDGSIELEVQAKKGALEQRLDIEAFLACIPISRRLAQLAKGEAA